MTLGQSPNFRGVFFVQLLFTVLNTWAGAQTWWRYIYLRYQLISEKNYKCMTMKFENLEDTGTVPELRSSI